MRLTQPKNAAPERRMMNSDDINICMGPWIALRHGCGLCLR
jgi:hypothetical protein